MAIYEEHLEEKMKAHTGVEASYIEKTFKRIVEDAIFFRKKAGAKNINQTEKMRYSRIVILLMAFYLESLSNLVGDFVLGKNWEPPRPPKKSKPPEKCKEKQGAKAILKFRAIHKQLYGEELALDTDYIQDIFTIRNRVIAHPAGRSQECTNGDRWKREDRAVSYRKFKDFPFTYSQFTPPHADRVLEEVKNFLVKFHDLLKDKKDRVLEYMPNDLSEKKKDRVVEDILNACWPEELIVWSKEAPKH